MRTLFAAALILAAAPALADDTTGSILAFDRVGGIIVLNDKTVWSLETYSGPALDLMAGDTVKIDFITAGDNGVGKIVSVVKVKS